MASSRKIPQSSIEREITIDTGKVRLNGTLALPAGAAGLVLFAHGSGSSRHSPRNRYVAQVLQAGGIGTLLFDLLTNEEEAVDQYSAELRFDIGLLAERLVGATQWVRNQAELRGLKLGYFGASTGAAAALVAAAKLPDEVSAVVSRGGRPDLAEDALDAVRAPTLLIVGGDDEAVIGMNRTAMARLRHAEKEIVIIPGATHLFEEPGKLEEVARIAAEWFARYLVPAAKSRTHTSSRR